jgi:hypothetical protein
VPQQSPTLNATPIPPLDVYATIVPAQKGLHLCADQGRQRQERFTNRQAPKAVLERQHYEIAEKNLQHLKQTFLSLHQNQKKHKKNGCGHNLMSVTHKVSGHHLHHE